MQWPVFAHAPERRANKRSTRCLPAQPIPARLSEGMPLNAAPVVAFQAVPQTVPQRHVCPSPRPSNAGRDGTGRGLSEAAGRVPQPLSRASSAGDRQASSIGLTAGEWAWRSLATFCRRTESSSPSGETRRFRLRQRKVRATLKSAPPGKANHQGTKSTTLHQRHSDSPSDVVPPGVLVVHLAFTSPEARQGCRSLI